MVNRAWGLNRLGCTTHALCREHGCDGEGVEAPGRTLHRHDAQVPRLGLGLGLGLMLGLGLGLGLVSKTPAGLFIDMMRRSLG